MLGYDYNKMDEMDDDNMMQVENIDGDWLNMC